MQKSRLIPTTAWICRSCKTQVSRRTFATTPASLQDVSPENPKYVDIPRPFQRGKHMPKPVKGVLPIPRQIIKRRKSSPEFAEHFQHEAKGPLGATTESEAAYNQWRDKMSQIRRKNLSEGLSSLRQRQERSDRKSQAASERKRQEREEMIERANREDDRLTNATLPEIFKKRQSGIPPDPDREQRFANAVARVQGKESKRREQRGDDLHTLYMQARNFIVTEAHLDKVIDEVFGTSENPARWSTVDDTKPGQSFWDNPKVHPPTVETLLKDRRSLGREASTKFGGESTTSRISGVMDERLKRVAGELTGGKL